MHEILTLQLGHHANYVGTHFWNTQESYFTYGDQEQSLVNHDVHFRAGMGVGGVDTFTPRALVYDLKGGFGSLRKINALYEIEDTENGGVWDRGTVIQQETPVEQVPYQRDLDAGVPPAPLTPDTVRFWSDFNRVYYHPRSMIQVNEYELNSTITPFEAFGLGRDLFKDLNREHDLIDRDFRLFAEECDQMQGVQVITSADDAWGGFAGEYIAELKDEYGKIGICTWGLEKAEKTNRDKRAQRTIALANTLSAIVPLTSVYVPLRNPPSNVQPNVRLDRASQWHTSGLISAAIETVTLPTRLREAGTLGSLGDFQSLLNISGRQNISLLTMSLCGNDSEDSVSASWRPSWRAAPDTARIVLSWEPQNRRGQKRKDHIFAQAEIARGFGFEDPETGRIGSEAPASRTSIFRSPFAYPVIDSFPGIFPTYGVQTENEQGIRHFTAVDTRLSTSSQVIDRLNLVKDVAARMASLDEREALVNDLGEMVEAYEEGWNSDSDEDDD